MTNNTNIYDIDGEIIRKAGDNHQWTIEEAKEKMEYYRKKILEVGEDSPNAVKYATYMRNLSQYIMAMYAKMTPEELNAEIEKNKNASTEEQIKKAIEDLKKDLEDDDRNTTEDTTDEIPNSNTPNNEGDTDEKPGNDAPIDRGDSDLHEERPVTQDDILVEREVSQNDLNMDEYVQFEELPVSDETSKQFEEV